MWSSVQEDEAGNLLTTSSARDAAALVRLRRHRLARLDGARSSRRLVRDMIRYVYLVVDGSHPMHERDPALPGGSTRFDVVLNMVSTFVQKYYDENPLSQLGLIVVRDGEAEMITRLTGSPAVHGAALVRLRKDAAKSVATNPHAAGGVFSLQNGLEVAGRSLGHMPRYGSREIVVIMGSLATCDPGDVSSDTLPRLKAANVRVSTVALQAEVHVCRRLADATGGTMGVCLDRGHLRDLLLGQCTPPPSRAEEEEPEEDQRPRRRRRTCDMVRMGFPSHQTGDVPSLVHAGSSRGGFVRRPPGPPRPDRVRLSPLPGQDVRPARRLRRVRAQAGVGPHLARSFHHLFPVPPFAEVAEEVEVDVDVVAKAKGAAGGNGGGGNVIGSGGNKESADVVVIGSAPPSCVASDADADATSSNPTYDIVGSSNNNSSSGNTSGSGRADETATVLRTVRIDARLLVSSADCDRCCFGCLKVMGVRRSGSSAAATATPGTNGGKKRRTQARAPASASAEDPHAPRPEPLRFQCPDCGHLFCADCDAYLHEAVHNCPGCLCAGAAAPAVG